MLSNIFNILIHSQHHVTADDLSNSADRALLWKKRENLPQSGVSGRKVVLFARNIQNQQQNPQVMYHEIQANRSMAIKRELKIEAMSRKAKGSLINSLRQASARCKSR
jgi:hypothetical protein